MLCGFAVAVFAVINGPYRDFAQGGLLRRLRLDGGEYEAWTVVFRAAPTGACPRTAQPHSDGRDKSREYSRPEQVAAIIQGLEGAMVSVIVLRPQMYLLSLQSHLPNHLQPFRDNLYRNYHKTKNFASGDEI